MRVRSGNAVLWNGSNVEEARAIAGENYVGLHSDNLLVRHTGSAGTAGEVCWVRPGWWLLRWDGGDDIHVFSGGVRFAVAAGSSPA